MSAIIIMHFNFAGNNMELGGRVKYMDELHTESFLICLVYVNHCQRGSVQKESLIAGNVNES